MMKKIKGFTLIELIVVMAILAIITGGLLGNFVNSQKKGRDARRRSDLKQVQNALEAYANDHNGLYPETTDATDAVGPGRIRSCPERIANPNMFCRWGNDTLGTDERRIFRMENGAIYMQRLPGDPVDNADYWYERSTDGLGYRLYALIENTDDDCFNTDFCSECGFAGGSACTSGGICNFVVTSSNLGPPSKLACP
jgi:prepilin-type N-terminal cleavage/methylation domain-containing protein